ncbi:MAG: ROK family protein [Verrucomicrobiota bacterium]
MRNAEELRQNLAQTLLHVRSGRATSRRILADLMRLSPTTAGDYVDQLIRSGHLQESGLEQGRMGRPKRNLSTVAEAGWFAGIEFNAERIQAVRLDFSGKLTRSLGRSLPEDSDANSVMEGLKDLISSLRQGAAGPLLQIGVGAPGIVDPTAGVGVHYSFLPGWQDIPLKAELGRQFKVPVIVENNLRVIALAERWFGGGRELDDYVILGPRSGFGIAVVKHGRLINGAHHATGEIGRWVWPLSDEGKEMHDALSSPAVWHRLAGVSNRARLPGDLHAALSGLADSSGEAWNSLIDDYARVIGLLHLLLDTPAYFLHGPLTALGTRFGREISERATKLMPALAIMPPKMVISTLGDNAGALGAASHAMEGWVPGDL